MNSAGAFSTVLAPSGYEAILALDQSVLDVIPSAIWVCSANGAIVRFNRYATELWGRAPRPGDSQKLYCGKLRRYRRDAALAFQTDTPIEAALRTGEPQRDEEVVIERPDGSRILAAVDVEPLVDESGAVVGAITSFRDVTPQGQRLEEAQREAELRSRAILDALPAAVYTTDADGTLTFFNHAAAQLAGREPEIGKDKWCVSWRLRRADGSVLPHDECPMARALKERRPIRNVEAFLERPDGTLIPFIPYPTPIFGPSGDLTGAVNMMVDITERKQSEATPRKQSARSRRAEQAAWQLASIVESSDDAIVSKDLDGVIRTWNQSAERLFGYAAEEVVGRPITVLIPEDHLDEEPRILRSIRRGERVEHYETRRMRKDGSLIDVSLTVSPVRDADGKVVGASKIARDISERKRREAALAGHMTEQAALYRFTERSHRARCIDEVYEAALDAIIEALGCSRASILLLDEANAMRFAAWRRLSDGYRRAVDGHSPWTADAGDPQPIFIDDVGKSDMTETLKAVVAAEGIGALGFVPLVGGGRLIGKFMTYYETAHAFSDAEAVLALTIARQLGFSIERMHAEEARLCAEEALRESERRLQMALEAGRMGAWEWDIATGKVVWSPGLEELHGLQPGTFGGTFEDFKRDIHPEDVPVVERRISEALATCGDYHLVYRINHPDGTVRWLEAFGRFAQNANGLPRQLAGVCMDITQRKEAELQRSLLVAELSHRVKNTLATVISIARQSFSTNPDANQAQRSFNARIRALGQTHGRLAEANWSGMSLETLFKDELAPYYHADGANLRLSGPPVTLTPKQALTLGMAIHELATNAAKYGALSTHHGMVDVAWRLDAQNKELRVRWEEINGPAVAPPKRNGFGRLLIERVLAADLGGNARMDFAKSGVACVVTLPLAQTPALD